MPRQIQSANIAATQPGSNTNDFKDRLVKLIPSEIVTAYITIQGLIAGGPPNGQSETLLYIVIGVLLILTPVYLIYVSKVAKTGQVVFTTVAFIIWVIVIGSPIKEILNFPASFIGSIMLVLYTLIVPFIYRG